MTVFYHVYCTKISLYDLFGFFTYYFIMPLIIQPFWVKSYEVLLVSWAKSRGWTWILHTSTQFVTTMATCGMFDKGWKVHTKDYTIFYLHNNIHTVIIWYQLILHNLLDVSSRESCKPSLTAHNWQKWKSIFLTCPCHEIYRVEAVGLKNSNYTLKIKIFVNMWNLGQFRENLIFCQSCLINVRI